MTCPACAAPDCADVGKLVDAEGILPPKPTRLQRCGRCHLYFRYPQPEAGELLRTYAALPTDLWRDIESRADFALAAKVLARSLVGPAVLEIGCFRGDFLMTLPECLQKFGVEPSAAAAVAAQRGVTLLGADVESVHFGSRRFDAILLFDVLEHLPHPMRALRRLRPYLAERGLLVIATGNTEALPWRLMRLDYWYYVTEHVCFFNAAWFAWAAEELDLTVRQVQKYSRMPASLARRAWQFGRCLAHRLHQIVQPAAAPPKTMAWRDHLLVVLSPRHRL